MIVTFLKYNNLWNQSNIDIMLVTYLSLLFLLEVSKMNEQALQNIKDRGSEYEKHLQFDYAVKVNQNTCDWVNIS